MVKIATFTLKITGKCPIFSKMMTENRDFISTDNLKYILGDTEDFEKDVEGFCDRAGEFNYRKFARRLIEQRTMMKYAN